MAIDKSGQSKSWDEPTFQLYRGQRSPTHVALHLGKEEELSQLNISSQAKAVKGAIAGESPMGKEVFHTPTPKHEVLHP